MGKQYSNETVRAMREMYADGKTQMEVRDHFKVSRSFTQQVLCGKTRLNAGGPIVGYRKPGPQCKRGKEVTAVEAVQMRHMRADGMTRRTIAEHFGVSPSTVRFVTMGLRHKEAGGPIEGKAIRVGACGKAAGEIDPLTGCPWSISVNRHAKWRSVEDCEQGRGSGRTRWPVVREEDL